MTMFIVLTAIVIPNGALGVEESFIVNSNPAAAGDLAQHGKRSNADRLARLLNKSIAAGPAAHAKNMRRLYFRIELNVITAAAPDITRVAEQIVHFIDVALHLPELINRHIDERMLFTMRIEIHYDENNVVARSGHFAVKQDCVVLSGIESQIRVRPKCTVFLSDFV